MHSKSTQSEPTLTTDPRVTPVGGSGRVTTVTDGTTAYLICRTVRGRGGWGVALSGRGDAQSSATGGTQYRVGERVRHAKFGVGEVVEADAGRVVIRFGTEERTFVPEIAPLSKVT